MPIAGVKWSRASVPRNYIVYGETVQYIRSRCPGTQKDGSGTKKVLVTSERWGQGELVITAQKWEGGVRRNSQVGGHRGHKEAN